MYKMLVYFIFDLTKSVFRCNQMLIFLIRFCDDIEFMTGNRPHFIWKIMWRFVSPLVIASLLIGMVVSSAKGTLTYEVWNDVQVRI